MERVVLVDDQDREIGEMEKLEAHEKGLLHRAISVCLFDEKGRWLIQRRARGKYHSPGQYANSCCSHPRKGEKPLDAALRRTFEELGVRAQLRFCTTFVYREEVGQDLVEHEYDYLFMGRSLNAPSPDPDEVESCHWWTTEQIEEALEKTPEIFASWFRHVFEICKQFL